MAKFKIIVVLLVFALLFPIPVSAGMFSGQNIGKYIGGKIQDKAKQQAQQEQRERNKKNNRFLKIKEKLQQGKKLTQNEKEFWKECVDRLYDKQYQKYKDQQEKERIENLPGWKKLGGELFGKWFLTQPEWQPEFYEFPMIEELMEPPPEVKELMDLGKPEGIYFTPSPLPMPMPIPVIP